MTTTVSSSASSSSASAGDAPAAAAWAARRRGRAIAQGLGWFSIGLGVAELLMPDALGRATGLRGGDGRAGLLRAYGLREVANGIGLLTARNPAPWAWARVAGDLLDIATVAGGGETDAPRTRTTLAVLAAVTLADVVSARALGDCSAAVPAVARDYARRSGLPGSPDSSRGAALKDFVMPDDFRTPALLRPYPDAG